MGVDRIDHSRVKWGAVLPRVSISALVLVIKMGYQRPLLRPTQFEKNHDQGNQNAITRILMIMVTCSEKKSIRVLKRCNQYLVLFQEKKKVTRWRD